MTIEVEDDGSGVAEQGQERILEPCVRLEESRARASRGTGLGLAIAQEISVATEVASVWRFGAEGARFVWTPPTR